MEHPEERLKRQAQYNQIFEETPEDSLIKDLYYCMFGFSSFSFDELLDKTDEGSLKVLRFTVSTEAQKMIKKDIRKRWTVWRKFGSKRKIMSKIEELEGNDYGHAKNA